MFPLILDSRPAYLAGASRALSLLQLPAGRETLLEYLHDCVAVTTGQPTTVITLFAPTPEYEAALRAIGVPIQAVVPLARLAELLERHEPSDWLLVLDPRFFPAGGLDLEGLLADTTNCRLVKHLVPLDQAWDGTREYVQFDGDGGVRRIQRYYDGVTQIRAEDVACTLISAAGAHELGPRPGPLLADWRSALSETGVLSRDYALPGGVLDLRESAGVLELSERFVVDETADEPDRDFVARDGCVHVGPRCTIAPTARIVGPAILHDGVCIDEGAMIVGPVVVGARARVHRDALVAHALVLPDTTVAPGALIREQVVPRPAAGPGASRRPSGPRAYRTRTHRPVAGAAPGAEGVPSRARRVTLAVKRGVDIVIAVLALLLLSPLMLAAGLLVRLTSRGPALFAHEREGRGGRVFRCYKFRTMVTGAHHLQRALYQQSQVDGPQFKIDRDPRVTLVGRWLRATNIDELPQFFNVLRGDMSAIGPRPSPFRENQICVPWRRARLSVRPGITGLWQICRNERTVGDFHQWIHYDTLYVQHLSLLLDLKIFVATLLTLGGRFSVPLRWLVSADSQEEPAEPADAPAGGALLYHPAARAGRAASSKGRVSVP
ncbi:MAG: sugar transferase [Phycisphaerae bacterium]